MTKKSPETRRGDAVRTIPKLARRLLVLFRNQVDHESLIGDFDEIYRIKYERESAFHARAWYWSHVLKSVPGFLYNHIYWRLAMLRNHIKIAFRTFQKHKAYTVINITGLALGMACSILILLWVHHELGFDKFHTKKSRIYRVIQHIQYSEVVTWAITQGPLAPALKEEIPEIEEVARYENAGWRIKYGDRAFVRYGGYVDPAFLKMFDFPLIEGDPETALSDPHSVVMTKKLADTIFGDEAPLGKTINLADQYDLKVTGVLEDIPDNSHLQFEFLGTMEFAKELGFTVEIWTNSTFHTYVLVKENVTQQQVESKIYNFLDEKPTLEDWEKLTLQPLEKIHLSSGIGYENAVKTHVQYVIIFFFAALFILIIACINFMNLSTARAALRSREVGLRKVAGARREQLIRQFFGESASFTLVAFLFAFLLIVLLLPLFNRLSGKTFTLGILWNSSILLGIFIIVMITGLLSGSYPAVLLSAFRPVNVLKGAFRTGKRGTGFRRTLVVFQFAISILLLVGTFVVYGQIRYMQTREIGYDRENLVQIPLRGDVRGQYDVFKQDLLKNPQILKVASAASTPTYGITFSNSRWRWEGKDPDKDVLFRVTFIDPDYIETFGMEMREGRSFSRQFLTDSVAMIVNETGIRAMGLEEPVGKIVNYDWEAGVPFHIIGVIQDFHFTSLRSAIEPMIYLMLGGIFGSGNPNYAFVRIRPENMPQTLQYMEQAWERYETEREFQYSFVDELFARLYRSEERIGHILEVFTVLAVCISCLGLFGLASFMAMRKTKEIGIRKVLGSSVLGIVVLMSKEFFQWVVIANLIAWPIAYFGMSRWLQGFAYRTGIGFSTFLLAGSMAVFIALITISYQAVRAALANPADSLRYE